MGEERLIRKSFADGMIEAELVDKIAGGCTYE